MIPFWLAVTVAVLGGLGPFAGSIGFVIAERRRARRPTPQCRSARVTVEIRMAVETGTVQVVMPAMGDSVAEGTVLEWHKQEGDTVDADETIVEISTDKVDAEVPSPVAGTVVKIHAAEGDTVAVGALLAEISTDGDGRRRNGAPRRRDARVRRVAAGDAGGGRRRAPPPRPEGAAAAQAAVGETIDIVTPTGGESVTEGTILEWSVKVGDAVKDGDTVVEISTDKVDMELPAPAAGTITEILAEEGDTVTVGQVIARMTARRRRRRERPGGAIGAGRATPAARRRRTAAAADGANASPVARRVAAERGRRPRGRRRQRPRRADHEGRRARGRRQRRGATAEPQRPRQGRPHAGAQLIKGGAAALARYMDESRSIPTATSFRTLTVTVLDARRKQLKDAGQRVSFTHLIAYAIARVGDRGDAGDGAPLRRDRRQAAPGRRRRRQPRARGRRREEGRHAAR